MTTFDDVDLGPGVTETDRSDQPTLVTANVPARARPTVAEAIRPLVEALVGDVPVRIELWDGSYLGPIDSPAGVVHVRSADAVRRLLYAPGELGLGRAYVAGDLDFDGDVLELIRALRPAAPDVALRPKVVLAALATARRIGALGPPLPPPREEAHQRGLLHSLRRDRRAISHHYDVGNEFYDLVLGESMTYSCARFARPDMTLVEAQASKHDLIARKLGLHERPGQRLLDVGCGWGSMAIHAATHHGARVTGVTISREQAQRARARVEAAGVADLVEIRLQDYRELAGPGGVPPERFDAISSIGMFEHVGRARMAEYFSILHGLLTPTGRLVNHAISMVGSSEFSSRTFIGRYVFPDGEVLDVGDVILAMQGAGFEVRDVESLREHYAETLRHWVRNLEANWDEAVRLVGEARARVWRLYMAGSSIGFEDGGLGLHQVVGVRATDDGMSGMPRTRDGWATGERRP